MAMHVGQRGPGHMARVWGGGAASVPASPTIAQLEVLSSAAVLDPVGVGPYDYNASGRVLRIRLDATVAGPLSNLDPTKFTVTINTPGYDANGVARKNAASGATSTTGAAGAFEATD